MFVLWPAVAHGLYGRKPFGCLRTNIMLLLGITFCRFILGLFELDCWSILLFLCRYSSPLIYSSQISVVYTMILVLSTVCYNTMYI